MPFNLFIGLYPSVSGILLQPIPLSPRPLFSCTSTALRRLQLPDLALNTLVFLNQIRLLPLDQVPRDPLPALCTLLYLAGVGIVVQLLGKNCMVLLVTEMFRVDSFGRGVLIPAGL